MDVRIKFLGGAKSVTGSRYLLEVDHYKLLIDCGLFQGLKDLRLRNWEEFPINPTEIDAIILTHAHLDHTGYLPKLVREGFSGKIYATEPTIDLVKVLLLDSAKLQEEEAEYAKKKGYSSHEDPQPLYTVKDAERVFSLLEGVDVEKAIKINPQIKATFSLAGHILGACIISLDLMGTSQRKKIVFSGDLGRYSDPVLDSPKAITEADILLVESTYGDRDNINASPDLELAEVIKDTQRRGGVVLIPAFTVGRTQLVLYYLYTLIKQEKIPKIPVYIDSPMAIKVNDIYKKHFDFHKLDEIQLSEHDSPLNFKQLHYRKDQDESMGLNFIDENAIIVSASGMVTGGRILHHLSNRLKNPQDTVLFVGFQAEGTRGRKILDRQEPIKIFGMSHQIKCDVQYIEGLSAHADRGELLHWLSQFDSGAKDDLHHSWGRKKCSWISSFYQRKARMGCNYS